MERRGFFKALVGASGAASAAKVLASVPEPKRASSIEVSPERAYALEFDRHLSAQQVQQVRAAWQEAMGGKDAPRIVILAEGTRISTLK